MTPRQIIPLTRLCSITKINFILLISRQGKLRMAKWYATYNLRERQKHIKEVTNLVLSRPPRTCSFIEYRDMTIVYKRYASLFFVAGIDGEENELLVLETLHRYVETLDRHFENVKAGHSAYPQLTDLALRYASWIWSLISPRRTISWTST